MKRIGEILVERGWVKASVLERALAKQREVPRRLCSLLIAAGVLDVDHASRALGEQHGVASVLQKHIEGRDRALVELLPAALARSLCALPIGRLGNGDLILCVRDPRPSVLAALRSVIAGPIVLAVAPAASLEQLVADVYGNPDEDFDVDLSTGPIATLDLDPLGGLGNLTLVELDDTGVTRDESQSAISVTGPNRPTGLSSAALKIPPVEEPPARPTPPPPKPTTPPPPAIVTARPPTIVPTISAAAPAAEPIAEPPGRPPGERAKSMTARPVSVAATPTTPPPIAKPAPPPPHAAPAPKPPAPAEKPAPGRRIDPEKIAAPPAFDPSQIAVGTEPPRRRRLTVPATMAETTAALANAATPDAATAAAMKFAAGRWRAALLLAVREKTAFGEAGHGNLLPEDVVAGLAIPLAAASIVSLALETGVLTTSLPADAGPVQDRLDRLLGMPRFPSAMTVTVSGRRAFIFVIGDPTTEDTDAATADLEKLAGALGAAYARLRHVTAG